MRNINVIGNRQTWLSDTIGLLMNKSYHDKKFACIDGYVNRAGISVKYGFDRSLNYGDVVVSGRVKDTFLTEHSVRNIINTHKENIDAFPTVIDCVRNSSFIRDMQGLLFFDMLSDECIREAFELDVSDACTFLNNRLSIVASRLFGEGDEWNHKYNIFEDKVGNLVDIVENPIDNIECYTLLSEITITRKPVNGLLDDVCIRTIMWNDIVPVDMEDLTSDVDGVVVFTECKDSMSNERRDIIRNMCKGVKDVELAIVYEMINPVKYTTPMDVADVVFQGEVPTTLKDENSFVYGQVSNVYYRDELNKERMLEIVNSVMVTE